LQHQFPFNFVCYLKSIADIRIGSKLAAPFLLLKKHIKKGTTWGQIVPFKYEVDRVCSR